MDTSILENLGLSQGEIKVYLTLLETGSTKVGTIIEKSGMASSAVHNSVNSLIDKGLITYIKKGKIKHYQAVPPKLLLEFVEDKKRKIQEILPELELKQKLAEERQEAEIFEGTKGVITMLNLLIEDAKKGEEYLFFAINVPKQNEEIQKFFLNYDLKRKEKGLVVKGIAPKEEKKLFEGRKYLQMKYTNLPIPSNISICNRKICFFTWETKPVGYLIKSRQLSQIHAEYFKNMWKIL
ncbi:MAG: helix-turn-helix domain-containing protein [Candidatus Woesearchaeota archaeon]